MYVELTYDNFFASLFMYFFICCEIVRNFFYPYAISGKQINIKRFLLYHQLDKILFYDGVKTFSYASKFSGHDDR